MGITGKQITNAVQILKLALDAKGIQLNATNVIDHAQMAANMVATDGDHIQAIERAIIERMVTIVLEAK